jgi:Zn-dependent peptidase ImmA (M78 family)
LGHLTPEEAASKIKIPYEQLIEWEDGRKDISISQLRKLAHIYNTSISTFYLSEPPSAKGKNLVDRRILPIGDSGFSPQLLDLIADLEEKQEWLSHNLKEQGKPVVSFGKFSIKSPIDSIVNDIKLKLNIDVQEQIKTKSNRESLHLWVDRAEDFGINVSSRSDGIPLEEFRAFVLYDTYAPFICLNSKDSPAGRLFSLCHELAHLWLGQSVISNIHENHDETEMFCNKIASHLLIDDNILYNLWSNRNRQMDLKGQIHYIAHTFSISEECVARYLFDSDHISREEYQELRQLYNIRWKYLQKQKNSGGPIYGLRMVLENGAYFTQQVLAQYHRGTLLGSEASSLLGVKINHVNALAEYLPPRM